MNASDLKVIVSVSDKYLFALKPFVHLFNKYWGTGQQTIIVGYSPPTFAKPSNMEFHQISKQEYPKEKWGDGMMEYLDGFKDDYFVLLLEDFWLCREADVAGVYKLTEYALKHEPDILRIDLSSDRQYAGGMHDYRYYSNYDIIRAEGSSYEMSLQAAIWNRKLFMEVLYQQGEDKSPWNVELGGTNYVNYKKMKVVGTRQYPVRYVNGLNNAIEGINYKGLIEEDIMAVSNMVS